MRKETVPNPEIAGMKQTTFQEEKGPNGVNPGKRDDDLAISDTFQDGKID